MLTQLQKAAVECDKNLIIFAGPGSGKTHTSISKAERILRDRSRTLIMCTFTVDAAGELANRLTKRFKDSGDAYPANRVRISTFDALALNHLKTSGVMKRKLLSPKAQGPKLRQMIMEMGLQSEADDLLPWFEMYQSTLDRSALIRRMQEHAPDAYELVKMYYEWLRAAGMVDLATVKRTCAEGMAAGRIPLFDCTDLLVDESQDSDELQMLMAETHGRSGVITTLVGDDDQTIYDWRSAIGYKGMQQFVERCDAEIVRLGENFRSHEEIVAAATRLIAFNNPNRIDKMQRSTKGPGGSVEAFSFEDPIQESVWVAKEISNTSSFPYDCAVLARRNRVLDVAESALTAEKIPYSRAGASLWDRDDIASYLGFMQFVVYGDNLGFSLALGYFGLQSGTINSVLVRLKEGATLKAFLDGQLFDAEWDGPTVEKVMEAIAQMCARWRKLLRAGEIGTVIGESSAEFVRWARICDTNSKGTSKRILRLQTGLELVAQVLEKLKGKLSERISVLVNSKKEEPKAGVVRLLTMHASKGLEFDDVYLIDCAEREEELSVTEGPAERRVMYVAMTRARKRLRICYGGPFPIFLQQAGLTMPQYEKPPSGN